MTQQTLNTAPGGIPEVVFKEKPYRTYLVNGLKVPSVTQVLGILDKPALKFWAQREAVNGVAALAQQYGADDAVFRDADRLEAAILARGSELNARTFVELFEAQDCTMPWERPWDILRLLKQSDESITARLRKAADRGKSLHAAWEDYADTGKVPDPALFPPEHRGYLAATAKFMAEYRPRFADAEVVVGSAVHGFGGRLDFLAYIEDADGHGLLDLKTNAKGAVYARDHFLQVEAYALAGRECGLDVGAWRAVVAIGAEGTFQFKKSFAQPEDFLSLLPAYRTVKRLDKMEKAAGR